MPDNSSSLAHNNPLYLFILPPLPELNLPPLPAIKDQEIYEHVITHVSVKELSRRNAMILARPDDVSGWEKAVDYERLEHSGDAILQSIATGIVHDLYPWLRQGGASIIRNHLVSNSVLAQLSTMYNLPSLIKAGPSTIKYIELSEKMKASVFEAWIAGLFYSFLKQGDGGHLPIIKGNLSVSSCNLDLHKEEDDGFLQPGQNQFNDNSIKATSDLLQPVSILKPTKLPSNKKVKFDFSNQENQNHMDNLENLISMMFIPSSSNTLNIPSTSSPNLISPLGGIQTSQPAPTLRELITSPIPIPFSANHPIISPPPPDLGAFPLPSNDILQPTINRTKGQAYHHVLKWLTPLLTPYCEWIYSTLLDEQNKILSNSDSPFELPRSFNKEENLKEEDRKSVGMPQALAQHPWIKGPGNKPVYIKEAKETQRWKVVCKVTDLNGDEWYGEATRGTVQAAKNVAAWKVYRQLGQ